MRYGHIATDFELRGGFRITLFLASGIAVERDLSRLFLRSPIFRAARGKFAQMRLREDGALEWPNGADICPDVLVWGGAPPCSGDRAPLARLKIG